MIARLLEKHVSESRLFNPVGIVEEFARTVTRELDFVQEGKNAVRFARNFKDHPGVLIPRVYKEYLSERVLVMERVKDGVRIDDIRGIEAMGLDRKELAKTGVDAYFKMILRDGFFHADPHPGNIFALPTGQIAFVDFGIVGRVTEELKAAMANTFLALIKRDFDRLIDEYVELGLISDGVDLDAFRRELKADLADFFEPLYDMTLGEINFAEYLDTVIHLAMKHDIRIPSDLLLVNKAMLILESIGTRLDPGFDFVAAAEPYASSLMRDKLSPSAMVDKLSRNFMETGDYIFVLPRQLKQILRKAIKDDLHVNLTHRGLEDFIRDMDRSSNRISFAMIISATLISSAIMHATGVGPKIYGFSAMGFLAFGSAAFLGIWLLISIIRSGRL